MFADSRLVAGVGLDDVVVVETPDAVLVARKDRTQDVKKIVARLKAEQRSQASASQGASAVGNYDSIDNGERFQVKRIVVKPGGRLSLQMHHHRAEHWIVVSGTAMVTRGEERSCCPKINRPTSPRRHASAGESGKLPLEMIEVQSGSYLGEDDIVRFRGHLRARMTRRRVVWGRRRRCRRSRFRPCHANGL